MPVQQVNILVKTWLVLISETHDYLFGNEVNPKSWTTT